MIHANYTDTHECFAFRESGFGLALDDPLKPEQSATGSGRSGFMN
jgi:hypothetical protein